MEQGLWLALVGVASVFAVMIALMGFISLGARFSGESGEEKKALPKKDAPREGEVTPELVAVITAALHLSQRQRVKVLEVERTELSSWRRSR